MGGRTDILDQARQDAGLSHIELWVRYFAFGGMAAPIELEAHLFGALDPGAHEHDLLVHALNERFAELGRGHPIAYSNPKITRSDRLERVRDTLKDIDGAGPGSWDRVCEACAQAVAVTGAGIIVLAGGKHRMSLGTSDQVEEHIEEAQFTLGEGPCADAGRLGLPVHEPDMAVSGQRRWPMFATRALDAGVAAIFAFPLLVGTECAGAMNLYRDRPGPLTSQQLADALAVADLVAHAVLALETDSPGGPKADTPIRAVVYQATGMISVQLGVSVAEALVRLRGHAYAKDRTIDEIAALVVARRLRFDDPTRD